MSKVLNITPLDPMFFRTPLPFTAGEQDWAPSLPLPSPGTLYGAIRSTILTRRNFNKFVSDHEYDDIGTPLSKGSLTLRTYFLAKEENNALKFYFPTPHSIFIHEKNNEDISVVYPVPSKLPEIVHDEYAQQFFYTQDDIEPETGYWTTLEGLKRFLHTGKISSQDLVKIFDRKSGFCIPEPKTGITRNKITKGSEIGKLYRTEHFRYLKGVSIVAEIEGTNEDLRGVFTLGGERRTAHIDELKENPLKEFNPPSYDNFFIVYLMTPAIFEDNLYPKKILQNLKSKGIELKIHSAVVSTYETVSGWDIQKNAPKTLYRAVPMGSVFLFEVVKGNVKDAILTFHKKNISEVNPEEGYGYALTGRFIRKEV